MGETLKRVVVVLPWLAGAIAVIVVGGPLFALAMIGLGALGIREYTLMASEYRPLSIAAYAVVAGMIVAAYFGTSFNVLLVVALPFPLMFALAAERKNRAGITGSLGITLLGTFWLGIPLAHAVLLRQLPDHGAALLIDVLVGTFITDTGAYLVGRAFGSHRFAPNLSPNKTIEGLLGGVVLGIMGVWFAGLYQDWLSGVDALAIGAAVAIAAPVGDLFESMIKRDLGTKDTGTLFGPHGGLLDRLDAVFFSIVAGYYVAVALLY